MCGKHLMAVLALLWSSLAAAGINLTLVAGGRSLDEGFDGRLDSHVALGATVDFGEPEWPVRVALGLHGSVDSEPVAFDELTVSMLELSAGAVWYPLEEEADGRRKRTQPYLGGGLALLWVDLDDPHCFFLDCEFHDVDDDFSPALYANGGVVWRLGERLHLGLDARWLVGSDVELLGEDFGSDYLQTGVALAWLW